MSTVISYSTEIEEKINLWCVLYHVYSHWPEAYETGTILTLISADRGMYDFETSNMYNS
jgi:hypothetical protein